MCGLIDLLFQPRSIAALVDGRVVAIPQVGGLHHRYDRKAA
jgi:hypothetical protein